MDKIDHHYLEDRIFNKEKQIMRTENQYVILQAKKNKFSNALGIVIFIPALILALDLHYTMFLNFGVSSLFLTPISGLILVSLIGAGHKIGNNIYVDKINKCQRTIQRLKEEKERYEKQLEKRRTLRASKQKMQENTDEM